MSSLSRRASADQLLFDFGGDLLPEPDPEPEELECWLPVPDWPGYEVSDLGGLRSYWGSGSIRPRLTPISIGGYLQKRTGHLQACLYRNTNGFREKWRTGIHVFILTAFKGPCPPGLQGCHRDSNGANNRLDNLRWDTPANNKLDLMWRPESAFKLSNEDILVIWDRLLAGERDYLIAKDYGVTSAVIGGIKLGDHWTHVTSTLPGFPIVTSARAAAKREPIRIADEFALSPVEIWRLLPGHPAYRVSTFGNVEYCRYKVKGCRRGEHALGDVWKPMSPWAAKTGHLSFTTRDEFGKKKYGVHVAVLLAFAGPAPPGMIGCHDNGDPSNNHASKIRWDSHKANKQDALRHAALKALSA